MLARLSARARESSRRWEACSAGCSSEMIGLSSQSVWVGSAAPNFHGHPEKSCMQMPPTCNLRGHCAEWTWLGRWPEGENCCFQERYVVMLIFRDIFLIFVRSPSMFFRCRTQHFATSSETEMPRRPFPKPRSKTRKHTALCDRLRNPNAPQTVT